MRICYKAKIDDVQRTARNKEAFNGRNIFIGNRRKRVCSYI